MCVFCFYRCYYSMLFWSTPPNTPCPYPNTNWFLLHCSGFLANTIGCMQYPYYENFCLMGNFPPTKFAAIWYSSKPFCSDQNISNAFTNIYLALTTNKSANNSGQHTPGTVVSSLVSLLCFFL